MKLAAAAVVAVAGVLAVPPAWAGSTAGVANVAHRGASVTAPENTLTSLAQAVADHADFIECDVQLTRDGVPVILHDPTLARTTNVESVFPGRSPWSLRDFTLAEVERLDAGSWKASSYAGERVPTLVALLRQLSQSPSGVFLEVKNPELYGGVDGIGTRVYDTIKATWPEALNPSGPRRLVVMSFDEGFVKDFAARYPDVTVGVLGPSEAPDTIAGFASDVEPYYTKATEDPGWVADAHAAGLTVSAWTVDDSGTMATLADTVDAIITNNPAKLRQVLDAGGHAYTGTVWPEPATTPPAWSLATSGRYLNSPVTVRATLSGADGAPARWQWAALQQWSGGAWRTVLRRATDAAGRFSATVPGTAGLRLRVAGLGGGQYPVATSAELEPSLRRWGSAVSLSGPARVHRGTRATLTVRWTTSDGRTVDGTAELFKRPASGGRWEPVRDLRVSHGYAHTRVTPRQPMSYRVRGVAGWWYTRGADTSLVRVVR